MTLWDHACCIGYSLAARWHAIQHRVQTGHPIRWRDNPEPWIGCTGDIVCETCDICFWCRHNHLYDALARRVCGWLGHPGWNHPTEHHPDGTETPVLDEVCCTRCTEWRHV